MGGIAISTPLPTFFSPKARDMIRIIIKEQPAGKPLNGLLYYKNGLPIGVVQVLQTLPRKPGQKDYEWEEVKIELG